MFGGFEGQDALEDRVEGDEEEERMHIFTYKMRTGVKWEV